MSHSFVDLVTTATATADAGRAGHSPYRWQANVAEAGLPELIDVETGAGKTEGVVLPWLWRRRFHPDPEVRAATPRWLVLCLPLRVLTEQVEASVTRWLANLGLGEGGTAGPPVLVHVAMGGREGGAGQAWRAHPEADAVVVGTVDMLLSRALNRGYAMNRFAWPIDFGLLHNGAHWVFDEVQLLGPALPASLQLEALRRRFGTAVPSATTWMSATVDQAAMTTVDHPGPATIVRLGDDDRDGGLGRRLAATRRIERVDAAGPRDLAEVLVGAHRRRPVLTVAVTNTVTSARALHAEVVRRAGPVPVTLLHSRFRPGDRRRATDEALAPPPPGGRIVVSTQVLEAGVDLSATTLLTEAAPWPSVVQRAGRCNRDATADDARLLWYRPANPDPYPGEDVEAAVRALAELEGVDVTATDLRARGVAVTPVVHQVLRAPDLLGLFDTAPDLSGNDIDVAPFIRVTDELDLHLAWRDLGAKRPGPDDARPSAEELCPVPVGKDLRSFAAVHRLWRFDPLDGIWVAAGSSELRPGMVVVADSSAGGYTPKTGWDPAARLPVAPVGAGASGADAEPEEPTGGDPGTFVGTWVRLRRHLADVERVAGALVGELGATGLTAGQAAAAPAAGRLHDVGKAHRVFQATMARCATDDLRPAVEAEGPWAKSGGPGRARHERRSFRHELASALALVGDAASALDGLAEPDLVVYLVAAHHGRVRLGIRSVPDEERRGTVLGIAEGDRLPAVDLPGGTLPASELSLEPMLLGRSAGGSRSWAELALGLRDRPDLGPFRLAFLEAVVRLADWRASAEESREEGDL